VTKAPRRLHLHFGAGRLGIGVVLPTLSPDLDLIIVQEARKGGQIQWGEVARGKRVLLCNSTGYRKWFTCVQHLCSGGEIDAKQLPATNSGPILLVVDHFWQVAPMVRSAASLSCSLMGGQSTFAELLADAEPPAGTIVLAFENTLLEPLRKLSESTNNSPAEGKLRVFHAVTDRICSDRVLSEHCIRVQCETHLSVIAAQETRDCFDANHVSDNGPVHLVPAKDIRFHARKKRALVNSLHQLLALFCFQALSERGIPVGGQYLPLVKAWFANKHPDLHHGVELYGHLRALELTWPLVLLNSNMANPAEQIDAEAAKNFYKVKRAQELYDILLDEAKSIVERFELAPDELKRLIDPDNLRKELSKYREHVLAPMKFMWDHYEEINLFPLFDKPNLEDLKGLEDLLTESFLLSMEKAMSKN
jgi:hypothetical protein